MDNCTYEVFITAAPELEYGKLIKKIYIYTYFYHFPK